MFKKGFSLFLGLALLFTALSGCRKNYLDFTDDILVIYSRYPLSDDPSDSSCNITIYNDGRVIYQEMVSVITDGFPSSPIEVCSEFTVDEVSVAGIQNVIARVNFMNLEENLDTNSSNGAYVYMTVHANGIERKCGGLDPKNERFAMVEFAVLSAVPNSKREECHANLQQALDILTDQSQFVSKSNIE